MYGLSAGIKMMVVMKRWPLVQIRRYFSKIIYFFFIKGYVHEFQ